jgi:activating signal cointegrator 1
MEAVEVMMKALTLHQPWASLLVIGAKHHETRSWPAPQTLHTGDLVAIHAALAHDKDGWQAIRDAGRGDEAFWNLDCGHLWDAYGRLPLGCVLGVATFAGCWPTETLLQTPSMLDDTERAFGDFSPGRYAWRFVPRIVLPEPIPARGQQGLWEWEPPYLVRAELGLLTDGEMLLEQVPGGLWQ